MLAEIRNHGRLKHLLRRPRCRDGSLDMRCKVNWSFSKTDQVTDYYDPIDPSIDISQVVIQQYLADQQRRYDNARFKELTSCVK